MIYMPCAHLLPLSMCSHCPFATTVHFWVTVYLLPADRCPRYPNLPTTCTLVYDPSDPCCKKPLCGDNRPTLPPTQAPTVGPSGATAPPQPSTPNPNGRSRSNQTVCIVSEWEAMLSSKIFACEDKNPPPPPPSIPWWIDG